MSHRLTMFVALVLASMGCGAMLSAADKVPGLDQTGKPALKSAGPLAFGPSGVLFVGDPLGAAIFAVGIEVPSQQAATQEVQLNGIDAKIAGLLGTKAEDVLINDVAVQPLSSVVYLSVSRGKGPDAEPAIVRVDEKGTVALLPLEKAAYSKLELKNAPAADAKDRRGSSLRLEAITDLAFIEGRLFIAGLSNEEFASKLRSVDFPFTSADLGTSVEIYHGAHGQFETRAPVRTFVPFNVGGEPQLLAAYTCTPLVRFPVSELKQGAKLRGTTIAELGNRNRPLDIIAYEKDGKSFLLMANSARGVMKVSTDNIEKQSAITTKIDDTAGLGYETIKELTGVEHLDKLGNKHALLLVRTDGGLNLKSIALP